MLDQSQPIRILFFGDIVGRPGRRALKQRLPELKEQYQPDLIFANAENAASGAGLTPAIYYELRDLGLDALTSGNHIWRRDEIFSLLADPNERLIRPANYPASDPGRGWLDLTVRGQKLRLINLIGNVHVGRNQSLVFPFADSLLADPSRPKLTVIDFHAEVTSEKIAFGHYLDGQVSAILGTHTHVQTNDARILPKGTAYLTDLGMTGPLDGVLGVDKEIIIKGFLSAKSQQHEVAEGRSQINGVYLELEAESGRALKIELIHHELD